MGRRGRNRDKRNEILAKIEVADPALYEELVGLRSTNPQAYRKQLRHWVQYHPIPLAQKVMANRGAKYRGKQLDTVEALQAPFQIFRNAVKAGNLDAELDELARLEEEGLDRPLIYQILDDRRRAIATPDPEPVLPRERAGSWRDGES